MQISQEDEILI